MCVRERQCVCALGCRSEPVQPMVAAEPKPTEGLMRLISYHHQHIVLVISVIHSINKSDQSTAQP